MRFLLDENVHQGLLQFLSGLGHDAVCSPKGWSNGSVFAKAVSDQRTLVTHDKDFADRPPLVNHPGIVLLRILPKELGQFKTALQRLLAEKTSLKSVANRLFLVFPDHHEELPFRAEEISW